MAFVLKDRVSETTTTTGTGTITLAGAETGFQAFSVIGNNNTTYYCITDGAAWEVGIGTYTSSGNTLARTTILSNSNGNTSPITLAAGVKNIFGVLPSVGFQTVQLAAGSASEPSFTFTGDTTTGIFSPGANTIAFTEGGVETMRIDSSGNVGIGTVSPTGELDVVRSADGSTVEVLIANTFYAASSTDEAVAFQGEFYQNDVAARRAAGYIQFTKAGDFSDNANASANMIFGTRDAGTLAERMRIASDGNVGIATTAPAAKLNVAGNTILSNVDMLNASYDSVSFSVAAEEITPSGLFFSPDGTRMYVTGSTGDDVNQYSLSTPWVVSSATFVTVFSIAGQETDPRGIFFRADGLKMYIVGRANDTVYQYALTTAWNISTASYESISFSVASQDTDPRGVFFKPNGLTMYITGITNDAVYQYALSTAWNVSTATFTQSFSVAGQETTPQDLSFTGDGSRMFILGSSGDDVTVYNLTTPWDISTAATTGQFSVVGQDSAPEGFYVKPDGTKFYMVGATNDTVYQYTIPSIEINLTGTTNINGGATVAQDLTVNGGLNYNQRVNTTASITSPLAWNSDYIDLYAATAQAGSFTISADAGTPTNGRKIIFRITSDATAGRVVTFTGGASKGFKPIGTNLGTSGANFTYTLTASKTTYFGAIYNSTSARWEILALSQET